MEIDLNTSNTRPVEKNKVAPASTNMYACI